MVAGMILRQDANFETSIARLPARVAALWGFRAGQRGTHTSRTIMLDELTHLLDAVPSDAFRGDCAEAVVAGNCLGKRTAATRKASFQRLTELYGLDMHLILFRALRHLWDRDEDARPTLALLLALARDPLLRASATSVLATPIGHEFSRQAMKDDLATAVEDRLNPATLDATVRNASSSWTQSRHLQGRSRKTRCRLRATPAATAYALLIGSAAGYSGRPLFDSPWAVVLDAHINELIELVINARLFGFLEFKHVGEIMDISFPALVTNKEREFIRRESHR